MDFLYPEFENVFFFHTCKLIYLMYITVIILDVAIARFYDVVVLPYSAQCFQFSKLVLVFQKGLGEMTGGCFCKQKIYLFIFPLTLNDGLKRNSST